MTKEILRSLRAAAKGGSLSACFILGRLYDEGWGVGRSPRAAMRWYERAAKGGSPEAYYFVGSGYSLGEGVKRSAGEALKWFRRASESGDLVGAYAEAVTLLDLEKDGTQGLRMMLKAARRGSGDAMDYLAWHHMSNGRMRIAERWARKAIKFGDPLAPLRLRAILRERPSAGRKLSSDRAASSRTGARGR